MLVVCVCFVLNKKGVSGIFWSGVGTERGPDFFFSVFVSGVSFLVGSFCSLEGHVSRTCSHSFENFEMTGTEANFSEDTYDLKCNSM